MKGLDCMKRRGKGLMNTGSPCKADWWLREFRTPVGSERFAIRSVLHVLAVKEYDSDSHRQNCPCHSRIGCDCLAGLIKIPPMVWLVMNLDGQEGPARHQAPSQ